MIRAEPVSPKPNGIAARAIAARDTVAGLPLASVRVDGGTQSRAILQQSVVEDYALAVLDGATFPAVIVFYDGSDHWLADGFHRYHAYKEAGQDRIPAEVRQGTRRDAILFSVGANAEHGLPRSNEDKHRAVLCLLNDDEWANWSDREIARQCKVGYTLVAKLRGETVTARAGSERTYTTKHGTTATMDTSSIGKTAKSKQPEQEMDVMEAEQVSESGDLRRGNKIMLPDGMTLEDVARKGMAREEKGESSETVAKSLSISLQNYRRACDIVFLHDRGGYNRQDGEIVAEAFRLMMAETQVVAARELIDPVAIKVWGDRQTTSSRTSREPARQERFDHAFTIIMQSCASAAEFDLPYLSADDAKAAAKEVRKARMHLQTLLSRILEIHE